ncbi:MAG: GNAT family N-acetyltransferase [Thalassovita sp.]
MSTTYQIRPALAEDAAGIAIVQVASWNTTYRGILPDALIDRISVEDRTKGWQKIFDAFAQSGQGGAIVAEQNNRIVGFGSYGLQRDDDLAEQGYDGEVTALYLEKEHQRAGVGRALMAELGKQAQSAGLSKVSLWVITANTGACLFYDALEGRTVATRADPQGGDMDERAYGWDDLSTLG